MKFSIVIPLYNKSDFIHRAIFSVLAQSYQDFELIVVNDGSTDKSLEIVKNIVDPRIRIISQKNRGVSAARNCGVAEAQSDFVAFLDADDEWLPGFLDTVVHLHDNLPNCGIWGTYYLRMNLDGSISAPGLKNGMPFGWEGILSDYFGAALYTDPFCSSSVLVSRKALASIGGFPMGVSVTEDLEAWMRIACTYPVAYKYHPLAIYHGEGGTHSMKSPKEDWHYLEIGKILLNEAKVLGEDRQSLEEYLNRGRINLAEKYLRCNNFIAAKKLLIECENSEIFQNKVAGLNRLVRLQAWGKAGLSKFRTFLKICTRQIENYFGLGNW